MWVLVCEVSLGVQVDTVVGYANVQVRAGRFSGGAYIADHLTGSNFLTGRYDIDSHVHSEQILIIV